MTLNFILYSYPIQEEWNSTDAYKKAVENGSLIKVDKCNNMVIISKITDELIQETINSHIDTTTSNNYEDELAPLDGGLRIEYNNLIIENQCCSELNDYINWKEILTEKSTIWKEIWIGHPSIYYRIKDSKIEFSEYYDTNPEQKDISTKMSLHTESFFHCLAEALSELNLFTEKLYKIIDDGPYENKEILKRVLIA